MDVLARNCRLHCKGSPEGLAVAADGSVGGFSGRADSDCQSPRLCGVRPGGHVCSGRRQFGDIVICVARLMSGSGPKRRFAASQPYVRSWGRSRHAKIVQPTRLSHICRQSMNCVALHDAARPCCNGAEIPQCLALHALRTNPAKSAAGLCYASSQLHVIGRRTARLTPAAPPSATHPRRSRGPPAGGSGANPRDWRRAAWGRARADASSRAAPRPAGPRAHGSPR